MLSDFSRCELHFTSLPYYRSLYTVISHVLYNHEAQNLKLGLQLSKCATVCVGLTVYRTHLSLTKLSCSRKPVVSRSSLCDNKKTVIVSKRNCKELLPNQKMVWIWKDIRSMGMTEFVSCKQVLAKCLLFVDCSEGKCWYVVEILYDAQSLDRVSTPLKTGCVSLPGLKVTSDCGEIRRHINITANATNNTRKIRWHL